MKHLPQNRDIFATQGGDGSVNIYKYKYPKQRQLKDQSGKPYGIIGSVEQLNGREVCQQPVASFDWHKDKVGLGVLSGFDQTLRVIIVTKLNLH